MVAPHTIQCSPRTKQSGFTLPELAVVLVIIGLILAMVSQDAKDVLRSASHSNVFYTWVAQWKKIYDDYYHDVGRIPGDNLPISGLPPTGRVGGAETNTTNIDNMTCENVDKNPGDRQMHTSATSPDTGGISTPTLEELMADTGIRIPQGEGTDAGDNACKKSYKDSLGVSHTALLQFRYLNTTDAADESGLRGNVMVISGLTSDIAKSFDNAIDGIAEPLKGRFRLAEVDPPPPDNVDMPETWGKLPDDDQKDASTFTAYWQMDQ